MKYDADKDIALAGAEMTMFANKDILNYDGDVIIEKGAVSYTHLQLESLEKIPTINNNVQWVTINNQQEINTNIY